VVDASRAEQFVRTVVQRTHHRVLVPVGAIDQVTLHALAFVESLVGIGDRHRTAIGEPAVIVEGLHVTDDREAGARLQQEWRALDLGVPLVVLESPSRSAATALLGYIDFLHARSHLPIMVTVALPETAPSRWWHPLIRNYFASRLKLTLLSRPGVSVLSVPLALPD
jgi:hypothetical protein